MAQTRRTSTRIASAPPTGRTSPSWRVRSSWACIFGPMSPISSRNMVPPFAVSNRPRLVAMAPVKAPRAWPNSSDSSSDSVSAVQLTGHERHAGARRVGVDGARDQLLARPRFAFDQDGRRRAGDARDQLVDLQHDRALADDVLEVGLALGGDGLLLGDEPPALERARDGEAQLLDVEGLRDVVVGAALDRLHRPRDVAEGGDQDDRRVRGLAGERRQHVEPARALHAHVGDDQVVAPIPLCARSMAPAPSSTASTS